MFSNSRIDATYSRLASMLARRYCGLRRTAGCIVRAGADLLFPPACLFCEATLGSTSPVALCARCIQEFRVGWGDASVCRLCASPLPAGIPSQQSCPRCGPRRYQFSAATALGVYRGQLQEAVLRMKQASQESLTLAVGGLLGEHLRSWWTDDPPDLLIPIPMHWTRRCVRGTNSAAVLAESAARYTGRSLAMDLLVCCRKVKKQGTLFPAQRFRNVRGAFTVSSGYDINGAHLLLIDDIMTTGATASEAARVLRRVGARRVTVAVVARGVGND